MRVSRPRARPRLPRASAPEAVPPRAVCRVGGPPPSNPIKIPSHPNVCSPSYDVQSMPSSNQIVVSGAREHNLKDISLTLPRDALVVITGLSGSGKSSLAFDTIYAEGQRRYVESLSAYARQFLGQMDKPDVDSIEGLSPAISIDQKTTSRNPRSTVGTVTEIYDYLRLLWSRVGKPHCPICGRPITGQSAEQIIDQVMELPEGARFMVMAPVVRGRKGEYGKLLEELRADGFARVRIDDRIRMLEESIVLDKRYKHDISVVIDRPDHAPRRAQAPRRLDRDRGASGRRAGGGGDRSGKAGGGRERGGSAHRRAARSRRPWPPEGAPGGGQACDRGARRARRQRPDRPWRDARRGHGVHLLRALRLPRARPLAGRAGAADLLVQLPPRRLRALPRAGGADGDRPRAARARPHAVGERGGDRAVEPGGGLLQLLRPGRRGDRRELRRRPRRAVGRASAGAPEPVPARDEGAAGDHLPQPLRPAALLLHALWRADRQPRKALPRNRVRGGEGETRGVHVAAALPGVRGRAAARGVARGAGRGHADRGLLRALRAARDRVAG